MKFKDVEIHFGRTQVQNVQDFSREFYQPQTEVVVGQMPAFDQDLKREMDLEQLLIDDPHGFEREIITSHLSG